MKYLKIFEEYNEDLFIKLSQLECYNRFIGRVSISVTESERSRISKLFKMEFFIFNSSWKDATKNTQFLLNYSMDNKRSTKKEVKIFKYDDDWWLVNVGYGHNIYLCDGFEGLESLAQKGLTFQL